MDRYRTGQSSRHSKVIESSILTSRSFLADVETSMTFCIAIYLGLTMYRLFTQVRSFGFRLSPVLKVFFRWVARASRFPPLFANSLVMLLCAGTAQGIAWCERPFTYQGESDADRPGMISLALQSFWSVIKHIPPGCHWAGKKPCTSLSRSCSHLGLKDYKGLDSCEWLFVSTFSANFIANLATLIKDGWSLLCQSQ